MSPPTEPRPEDLSLVEAATETIRRFYAPDRHHVAAAVRTRAGRIYTAVNLGAYVGRCALCAEGAALAKAVSEGEREFDAIVAVRWRGGGEPEVVTPCGICRELLVDYGDPDVLERTGTNGHLRRVRASALLPSRYSKREDPRG